ncbi:MAG: hypothetical protein AAFN30_00710, partial [Actinomycetota bacterium]
MAGDDSARVAGAIAGRPLSLSNLDKVMYPEIGFTKAQVIDYYARIAPVMVPHVAGRCMTLRRWPDGVEGDSFFNKRCPDHRPSWLGTSTGPGDRDGEIHYCRLDEPAAGRGPEPRRAMVGTPLVEERVALHPIGPTP